MALPPLGETTKPQAPATAPTSRPVFAVSLSKAKGDYSRPGALGFGVLKQGGNERLIQCIISVFVRHTSGAIKEENMMSAVPTHFYLSPKKQRIRGTLETPVGSFCYCEMPWLEGRVCAETTTSSRERRQLLTAERKPTRQRRFSGAPPFL